MIDNQKRDAFNFCRLRESEYGLAVSMRSGPVVHPSLQGDLVLCVDNLQRALISLRLRSRAPLRFIYNSPRVLLQDQKKQNQGPTHIRVPPPVFPELQTRLGRWRQLKL